MIFLKNVFENILRVFQIKQSFLSNQVGGCWSFYCEHTQFNIKQYLEVLKMRYVVCWSKGFF
jgi:hypothetical protein